MTPHQFLAKLAALVPPPHVNMIRYAGCFANRHHLRPRIVPTPDPAARSPTQLSLFDFAGKPMVLGPRVPAQPLDRDVPRMQRRPSTSVGLAAREGVCRRRHHLPVCRQVPSGASGRFGRRSPEDRRCRARPRRDRPAPARCPSAASPFAAWTAQPPADVIRRRVQSSAPGRALVVAPCRCSSEGPIRPIRFYAPTLGDPWTARSRRCDAHDPARTATDPGVVTALAATAGKFLLETSYPRAVTNPNPFH